MKNYVPDKCPICDNELTITDMLCHKCDTHISGEFYVSKFTNLTKQQLEFVEVFIKCIGSIKEVEKELSISYPVESKLIKVWSVNFTTIASDIRISHIIRQDHYYIWSFLTLF